MTEGPYKLPKGWRWVRLGEVCRYDRCTIDPRRSPERTFYLYSIPAYDKGQRPERLKGSQIGSSKVAIEPGVCLFSKLNPRIQRAWVVAEVPQDGVPVASTEFVPLRPKLDKLDLDYLGKLLVTEGFLSQVRLDVTGATGSRQRLRPEAILGALIPLPPLEEQRRIVVRIEALMERIREAKRLREQARQEAERLWQAVLAEVFPRPGDELPPGWRWVRLGEVCRYDRRTVDPRRSPERTFYLYSIPAYDKGQRPERLDGSQIGSSKVVIEPGVCLFSKLNPRIPRAWVVAGVPQDGVPVASTEFMPLQPNPNVLGLDYLGKLLVTEGFLSQVRPDVTGATGSRQRSKPEVILNALIPLPPLPEQRRIVAHLEAVREKVKALKEAQATTDAELQRLEQAILDRAFRGEL